MKIWLVKFNYGAMADIKSIVVDVDKEDYETILESEMKEFESESPVASEYTAAITEEDLKKLI